MEKSISNMFYCLSHHPEIGEKVKKKKAYLSCLDMTANMNYSVTGVLEILCHSSNMQLKRNDTCPNPSISTKRLKHSSLVRH